MLATAQETLPGDGAEAGGLVGIRLMEPTHDAVVARQERERRIDQGKRLLAPAVAAAARQRSPVDVVPLIAGLSGLPVEDVQAGLSEMTAGGIFRVIGDEDPDRAGLLRIAPTEIALEAGYRVLSFDVGGQMPLPRDEIVGLVLDQATVNARDGAGQRDVDLRIAAAHEIYFPPALPITAGTPALPTALAA